MSHIPQVNVLFNALFKRTIHKIITEVVNNFCDSVEEVLSLESKFHKL